MRVVYEILLFLLPFAVFFTYARWANKRRAVNGVDPLQTPWFWLVALGLVLAAAGFFVMRWAIPDHTGIYVPAQVGADGKLVPGHFEGDDSAPPHVPKPTQPPAEPPPPPVPSRP